MDSGVRSIAASVDVVAPREELTKVKDHLDSVYSLQYHRRQTHTHRHTHSHVYIHYYLVLTQAPVCFPSTTLPACSRRSFDNDTRLGTQMGETGNRE